MSKLPITIRIVMMAGVLAVSGMTATGNSGKLDKRFGPPLAVDAAESLFPVDWIKVYAKKDGMFLRIAYQCRTPIDFSFAAAYSVFIDVDNNRKTGFVGGMNDFPIGADYLLQGSTLYRYDYHGVGDYGIDWQWSTVDTVKHEIDGTEAEFWVPIKLLDNAGARVGIIFYGDNTASGVDGESEIDLVPDNALKPGGGGKYLQVQLKP